MLWLDKILSHTALVKAKNKQLVQYSNQIDYLRQLLTAVNEDYLEGDSMYAIIASQKAKLCSDFFSQLKEEQQKNEELKRQVNDLELKYSKDINEVIMDLARREGEILSLKHMLDRYELELEKLKER